MFIESRSRGFLRCRNAKDKVHRTIEDELVEAFIKVGAIPQAHADDMSKVGFRRRVV